MNKENANLKQRLKNAGLDVVRVEKDGAFCGMAIYKNGVRAHEKETADYDFGLSLCGFFNT